MVWFGAENRVEVHKNDEKCENVFVRDGENRKLDRILHRKYCSFFFFMHNNEMRGGSLRTERQNMDFPAVLRTV